MENRSLDTTKLWESKTYTKTPNDILGWLLHDAKTETEVRLVLFIVRCSHGFHRKRTHGRLCQDDFARELGCNKGTISRTVTALLRRKRLFRFSGQGEHFFYSLYDPSTTDVDRSTTKDVAAATGNDQHTTPPKKSVASMQPRSWGAQPVSSLVSGVLKNMNEAANMPPQSGQAKKALKNNENKSIKAASAAASADACAEPATSDSTAQSIEFIGSQNELEMHLGLSYGKQIAEQIRSGFTKIAPDVKLPRGILDSTP